MNGPNAFPWSKEAVADLRRLRTEGWSATQIAKQLSTTYRYPLSRNSVIGKANRMGIPGVSKEASAVMSRVETRRAAKPAKTQAERVNRDAIRERRAADLLRLAKEDQTKAVVVVPIRPVVQHPDDIATSPCCLEALTFAACRWPLERTGAAGETLFCSNDKVDGRSYCEGHAKRAYVKTQSAEQKRDAQVQRERNRAEARAAGLKSNLFGFGMAKRFA